MKFQSIKTSKLNANELNKILYLKDSYWKFGRDSQLEWFKKNSIDNDINNIMIIDNEIVGYTFLANRNYEIINLQKVKKKLPYILFSTLILDKKYRNFYYASNLMKFNLDIIIDNKKSSFLLCDPNKLNFYKFFGWKCIEKKKFNVPSHNISKKEGMVYNLNDIRFNEISNLNFYY